MGFSQIWSGVIFFLYKGASHMVPQTARAAAQEMFKMTIAGHNLTETLMNQARYDE